ncbi:hypothetical protein CJF42_20745 [Pseudoalteromonas sp. NBT06-2]|uniref:S8 family serine peptidase n=1 Tax=Pseudoalteromonas sp. NBT06-2 TaxID=2025950 RepID=UPI000BA6BC64|nr:S8 family serine peptidase [Pseudoalteromonas sp. NBT06-2]PAJ72523.1 hypothetical protein CJF42_20745 [Pseudoalteromonas sp. NBT06-2]
MKKSHLCLAISAILSVSAFTASAQSIDSQTTKNLTYSIIAPEQSQLLGNTNGIQARVEQRLSQIANIQLRVKKRLAQAGIRVSKQLKNLGAISFAELTDDQVKSLRAQGYIVEVMGSKQLVESSIQAQNTPWGIDRVRSPDAWIDSKGEGVKICVIDTGIDYNHDDLKDTFVKGISTVGVGAGGSGSDDPMDTHYHGTHVSGTIAAADNDIGVVGVAPSAGLYNVGAFSPNGSAKDPDILAGLDWCLEQGTDIVSMSYGGSETTETEEVAYKAAYDSGIVLVAASGNDGATAPILYPGRYPWTIAVGATTSSNNIASFSQRGPELDVVAPGSGVNSTEPGNGYRIASGTSMATPHVAGVSALIIAKLKANGVEVNTDVVRDYLKLSALDLGDAGRDNTFGAGLVDSRAALDLADGGNMKPVATYDYDLNEMTVSFSNNSYDRDGSIVSVVWDFGDGTTSSESDPVHTYAAYGTYTVTLTVIDDAGDSSVSSQDIQVKAIPGGALENGVAVENIDGVKGEQFHWWLDVNVDAGKVLDAISFAISGGSGDADIYVRHGAKPTTSTYDYRPYKGGNNETVNVVQDDLKDGRWYVMVRSYSDYSDVDLVGNYSTIISNNAPESGFTTHADLLTVTFIDSSSDNDGDIVEWLWDFGDGNISTEQSPVYTYSSAGAYTVSLTVTDNGGATNTSSQTLEVVTDNNDPVADFTTSADLLTVNFIDNSSDPDGQLIGWLWSFGDGNTSTEQNPVYTYESAGTYAVSLTVTDDDSAQSTVSAQVQVVDCVGEDCAGETYSNNDVLVIPDSDWLGVKSNISVDRVGDSGQVSVKVRIVHDDADQLLIKLRAPDGTKWYVSKYEDGNVADGIDKTLTFDASGIDSEGTWKLYLYDRTRGVEGELDNWSITF